MKRIPLKAAGRIVLTLAFATFPTWLEAAQTDILLPLNRTAYQTNEWIDLAVVRGDDGSHLKFTFSVPEAEVIGAEARYTEHLSLDGRLLRPGRYEITVAVDGATAATEIDVSTPATRRHGPGLAGRNVGGRIDGRKADCAAGAMKSVELEEKLSARPTPAFPTPDRAFARGPLGATTQCGAGLPGQRPGWLGCARQRRGGRKRRLLRPGPPSRPHPPDRCRRQGRPNARSAAFRQMPAAGVPRVREGGGLLCVLPGKPELQCLGFDGKLKWRQSLGIATNTYDGDSGGFDVDRDGVFYAIAPHDNVIHKIGPDGRPAGEIELHIPTARKLAEGIRGLRLWAAKRSYEADTPASCFRCTTCPPAGSSVR